MNKIIDLRTQLVACRCNWINNDFMVFIIVQSLSSKFGNFVIVIETRLDEEEVIFSLDNLLKLLLKYEETLNKKVLISYFKDNNVALGATKTPFKKRFKHQNKSFPSSSKKFEKKGNNNNYHFKQRDKKSKASNHNIKVKFDGNCNFCGDYGCKEFDYYKKKREEKNKGNRNVKNFKGKKNIQDGLVSTLYSMTHTFFI